MDIFLMLFTLYLLVLACVAGAMIRDQLKFDRESKEFWRKVRGR